MIDIDSVEIDIEKVWRKRKGDHGRSLVVHHLRIQ